MPPAIFFPLLFLLASAATTRTTIRPTTPATTAATFIWPTTTTTPPGWCRDYLRLICPKLNCPDAIPHNYASCQCGYCPDAPAPKTTQTTLPTLTVTTDKPRTTFTTPTITTGIMTYPTTTITTQQQTFCTCCSPLEPGCGPTTTTPVPPLPCLLLGLKYNCVDPPCVDKTWLNSHICPCGTCPNGPNCYAWDGSIIPAGEPVVVHGAMCECQWKTWADRFSPYANCRWGVISG